MNFSPSQERQHIAETADISPKGWSLFRIKYLLKEIDSRTDTGDEVLLSMRQNKGLIPHKDVSSKIFRSEDLVGYKIVHPGQLVMNRMRASIGLFATSHSHGLVSPDYAVFKPLRQINLDYLVYLFRTPDMGKIFRIASRGMGTGSSGFLRLYTDRFGAITIIIPTFNEQGMIVDFVRSFDKAMSKLIRNKRKLIDLLKEQKQNIITKAVTQGINPDARLKPSGLQWLGNVPEHWETRRLRHICSKFGSGITPRGGAAVYQSSGIPLLRSQNIHFGGLELKDVAYISRDIHDAMKSSHVKSDDVLLNITGASIGRVCHVPKNFCEGNVNQHVCIIRPNTNTISPPYLAAYLSTPYIQREIVTEQNGASREGLTLKTIKSMTIPLPCLEEQIKILEFIADTTLSIESTISHAEHEIELMREYRARLISDVVTGKVDVRNIELAPVPEEELLAIEDDVESIDDAEQDDIPETEE